KACVLPENPASYRVVRTKSYLFNKARLRLQQNEAETAEAKRIGKEIDSLTKQLTELRSFDDQLKHYADMKIQLDLDDGVKVNYGKFGTLLAEVKAITGDKAE
ncbi:BREX-1 system adenine-specific DNA-methyltransferase PglX, partial [Klebsiella pneumoniae]|nr:BREX-1 system adenine-specific DNA-methyltransferase PglX [Klebsiella pneumoniae]